MSYSYSKISRYQRCPRSFYYHYIEQIKVPFQDTPIFEKGRYIHHIIEHYPNLPNFEFKFKESLDQKDFYLKNILEFIKTNKKMNALLSPEMSRLREKTFFIDNEFHEVDTKEQALFEGTIDYIGEHKNTIILVDWKTGQSQKYASLDQLKFYSLYIFNKFPDINNLKVMLFFVEQDKRKIESIDRIQYEDIKLKYLNIVKEIENDNQYIRKKSQDCINCEFYNNCKPFNIKLTKEN